MPFRFIDILVTGFREQEIQKLDALATDDIDANGAEAETNLP